MEILPQLEILKVVDGVGVVDGHKLTAKEESAEPFTRNVTVPELLLPHVTFAE